MVYTISTVPENIDYSYIVAEWAELGLVGEIAGYFAGDL